MRRWFDRFDRAFPRLAFARHLSPASIARRIVASSDSALRRFARLPPAMDRISAATCLRAVGMLPPPIMPTRARDAMWDGAGWRFTFLNRTIVMPGAIDWQAPSCAPADQLWRMNLHYMEYLENLDAMAGAAAIKQWIAANPATRSGAASDAWNSYALSIRLVSWMQWLARHDDSEPARALRPAMAASMIQQIAYLMRHLERDIGGNHLMKNIKALLWAAAAFDGPDAERWHATGWRLLTRELRRQILPDGVHYERSPAYHAQVAVDLIEMATVLPEEEREELDPTIIAMVGAATALSHPDGLTAQFNDCGLTMAYSPAQVARAALAIGLDCDDVPATAIFPHAGMAAWHDGCDSVITKLGPIVCDDLPAHGHGDVGSFELSVDGRRCIVDQGVYSYYPGAERMLSRSAAAHNVTQVEDWELADFFGAFRMGWRIWPKFDMAVEPGNRLVASTCHSGFDRSYGCGPLTRTIETERGRLIITDRVRRASALPMCSRLLIHPDWTVAINGPAASLTCGERRVGLTASFPLATELAHWWPDMGKSLATVRLVMLWPAGAAEMTQIFDWHDSTDI